jgi:NAD(P)H-dependent flavin oxidoreductase YrpB (nitropropane dioxygenase family)
MSWISTPDLVAAVSNAGESEWSVSFSLRTDRHICHATEYGGCARMGGIYRFVSMMQLLLQVDEK